MIKCEPFDALLESILPKLTKEEINRLDIFLPNYYFSERKPVQKAFIEHNLIKNLIYSINFVTDKDIITGILRSSFWEENKDFQIEKDIWEEPFYAFYINVIEESTKQNKTLIRSGRHLKSFDTEVDFADNIRSYLEKDVTIIAEREYFGNVSERIEKIGRDKNVLRLCCILDTSNYES